MDVLSVLSGGLTGLLGSGISAWANFKTAKLKNEHDQAMAKIEQDTIKVEAEANIKITQAQTEGSIAIAETDAFKDSMSSISQNLFDKSYMDRLMSSKWTRPIGALISLLFGLVDFLTRLARPALTYYLVGASSYVTLLAYAILKEKGIPTLTTEQAYTLFNQCVTMILYLTSTIVAWWFCDRQLTKFAGKVFGK